MTDEDYLGSQRLSIATMAAQGMQPALMYGLLSDSIDQRAAAIDNLQSVLKSWTANLMNKDDNERNLQTDSDATRETHLMLSSHVLVMLRMSQNCPFADVRERFQALLLELERDGVSVPRPVHDSPSFFIPRDKIVDFESSGDVSRAVMEQAFLHSGRFSNVSRLMIYFPDYMEKFTKAFNQIQRFQGPLPRYWRNYIAIMAAAQHSCHYLVNIQIKEFLVNGGDTRWLQGIKFAPQKLQNLVKLNALMAHQPWMIRKSNILELTRGENNYSKSELVLAIVVMATFHSLSSFVLGCGVVPDSDMLGGVVEVDVQNDCDATEPTQITQQLQHYDDVDNKMNSNELDQYTEQLMDRLQKRTEVQESEMARAEIFANLENQETFEMDGVNVKKSPLASPNLQLPRQQRDSNIERFLGDFVIHHVDFDVKSSDYSIFRQQDWSWEEHGVSVVAEYLPELGDLIDQEFSAILNLTDYSLSNSNDSLSQDRVDTWPFRQATWYYVLRLAGVCHDDYNYHEVNVYLNKRIKQYIKKVACYPEMIVPADFSRMGFTFRPDEKCHINLLASEARKCAELLYALHAVTQS